MHTLVRDGKRRKNFYLSVDLHERAELVAKDLDLDFSQLMREALRQYLEKQEQEAIDRELAIACENYREFNKRFSPEWSQFETRIE